MTPTYNSTFKPRARPTATYKPGAGSGLGGNQNAQAVSTIGKAPNGSLGGDPGLLAAQDSAKRQTDIADASALFQTGQIGSSYGYDAMGGIDVNNPYSRAALLQESYTRSRAANQNGMAAQGQLYSGALKDAQSESTRQYAIGDDQLRKGYAADQANVLQTQLGAYASAGSGVNSAAYQALLNKLKGGV